MATTTWQGDESANWNVGGNWDTGSVPTAADDVVLSNSAACTINANAVCRSLNASSYTGTLTHNAGISLTIGDGTAGAGNVALAFNTTANMTYTLGSISTSSISFISTSATVQTINFNSHNTGNVTFNASSNGSWQLTGQWGSSASGSRVIVLTKGSLDINDQTCYWGVFDGSNSNTRTLTLGSSTIYMDGSVAGNSSWNMSTTTGLTFDAETSTIYFSYTGSNPHNLILSGGKTFYTITCAYNSSQPSWYLSSALTVGTLNIIGGSGKTYNINLQADLTVNTALNIDGNSAINRFFVVSNVLGTARTITLGASATCASNCTNVDFRDITMSGGAANERDLSAITGGSGDCGGNTGITFTTADDWYWNGSGTRNFSDYTYWYDTTNGGGSQMASTRCPLPQDTCYINGDSIDGATTIDIDMPRVCKTLDCTGASAFNLHMNNISQTFYGSLLLSSNVTLSLSNSYNYTFEGRSNYSLETAGKFNNNAGSMDIYMIGGKLTLGSNALDLGTTGGRLRLYNGSFDANDQNVNAYSFTSSNSNTRRLYMGNGTWTLGGTSSGPWDIATKTNLTLDEEQSTILFGSGTTNYSFDGNGEQYYNLTCPSGTGAITIAGSNTFNTFTINAPKTVKFTAGTTTTVSSFVATGDASNLIHIDSTSASAATLTDASGTNTVHYCHIGETGAVNAANTGTVWDATDNCNVNASTGWTTAGATATGFMTCGKFWGA